MGSKTQQLFHQLDLFCFCPGHCTAVTSPFAFSAQASIEKSRCLRTIHCLDAEIEPRVVRRCTLYLGNIVRFIFAACDCDRHLRERHLLKTTRQPTPTFTPSAYIVQLGAAVCAGRQPDRNTQHPKQPLAAQIFGRGGESGGRALLARPSLVRGLRGSCEGAVSLVDAVPGAVWLPPVFENSHANTFTKL